MSFALIVTLAVTCAGVRVDDWYVEDRNNGPGSNENSGRAACMVESCTATGLGRYEVRGRNATALSQQLRPETRYFVGSSCEGMLPNAEASVVQWLDAKDPLNNSSIAIYLNPLLENRLQGNAKLCAAETGLEVSSWCVCQLTGQEGLGAVRSLARQLPTTVSEKLMTMQRRCPAGVLDLLAATVTILVLLIVGVTLHALFRAWKASKDEESKPSNSALAAVIVKTPKQSFFASYSWALGFVTSLAGLQMGALVFVRKSSDSEEFVWFVAAFPVILATAGVIRLTVLLCKQQLVQACLEKGCVLTQPLTAPYLDIALLVMMAFYLAIVLTLVASNLQGLLVALVALAGSAWALLKAIQMAKDLEAKLPVLEVNSEKCADFEASNLKFIPWASLLLAGRSGLNMSNFLEDPKITESEGPDFSASDIFWHNRSIWDLTASPAVFLILPSLVALVATSLGISALHMASYACSCGELSDLKMASGLHSLNFTAYQDKYEVMLDISFRQVAMVASAPGATTRWINFTQPFADGNPEQHLVNDRSSSATAEIRLPLRRVPRVADVRVQGLRPSLGATEYQVRFSPLTTVPTMLEIEAKDYNRRVVWSTLPGSTISVPSEGLNNFTISVMLSDYFLNLPLPSDSASNLPLWTEFYPTTDASETACSTKCRHSLNCFDFFLAEAGCFFVRGNRSHLSTSSMAWSSDLSAAGLRNLSGHLFGCTSGAGQPGACSEKAAMATDGVLTFSEVTPDWRDKEATLTFTLVLEVGEQCFRSEVGTVQLHRGPPIPSDALAILLGDSANGTEVINATTTIDPLGNVVVNVSRYDPMKLQKLRLLVVPLLADEAFTVAMEAPSNEIMDFRYFENSERCLHSPFLRERYPVCGANQGWPDQPLVLELDPCSGRTVQGDQFNIFPEESEKQHRIESRKIIMAFSGVDSPAAFAVETHDVITSLLPDGNFTLADTIARCICSSADATVLLLQNHQQQACNLVASIGLVRTVPKQAPPGSPGARGMGVESSNRRAMQPVLPQEGAVKTMLGLQSAGCKINNTWTYSHHRSVLQLEGYYFAMPLSSLLMQILRTEENNAMNFLSSMQVSSSFGPHDQSSFYVDLAQMTWQLLDFTLLPKVLPMLAILDEHMPQVLLDSLLKSQRFELEALQSMDLKAAAEAFRSVKVLKAKFDDSASLGLVAVACRLSPGLERLEMRSDKWSKVAGKPLARHWKQISLCMRNLKSFRMTNFTIPEFPLQLFQYNTSLQRLDLSDNAMAQLPKQLPGSLRHLKTLVLNDNQLTELPEKIFQHLTDLEDLHLTQNDLTSLPPKVCEPLKKLKELTLSGNELKELPQKLFDNVNELKTLSISRNQLTELPEKVFENLKELKELYLYENRLKELPKKVLESLKELKKVYLDENELGELPDNVFQNLKKLEELYLDQNQLKELPEKVFHNLKHLQKLYLHRNQLKELPEKIFNDLQELKHLKLQSNQLTGLPEKVFEHLEELEELSLYLNQLKELPENVFQNLKKLKKFCLIEDQLKEMPEKLFKNFHTLKALRSTGYYQPYQPELLRGEPFCLEQVPWSSEDGLTKEEVIVHLKDLDYWSSRLRTSGFPPVHPGLMYPPAPKDDSAPFVRMRV